MTARDFAWMGLGYVLGAIVTLAVILIGSIFSGHDRKEGAQ